MLELDLPAFPSVIYANESPRDAIRRMEPAGYTGEETAEGEPSGES
jgi:hypothetical protein